jgi:YVTN family beta-propeller protein
MSAADRRDERDQPEWREERRRCARRRNTRVRLGALVTAITVGIVAAFVLTGIGWPLSDGDPDSDESPDGVAQEADEQAPRPGGIYAAATATRPIKALRRVPARVYVPNSDEGTVSVIDPERREVVDRFEAGVLPHHVTPSQDMKRLYVTNTVSNSLTVVNPRSGKPVRTIPVTDPYNLYFTPDGEWAIVVAERYQRLDFVDPESWEPVESLSIPWPGVNHLDFSRNGRYLITSTEFSGQVVKVNLRQRRVTGRVEVGSQPVDVKVAPDGRHFYVTNQGRGGVSVIDPRRMREVDFLPTGAGAHGLAISRDARSLYVTNRDAGSISVIDFERRRVTDTWQIGGSPDMIQISPDGRELWTTGRYHSSVYVVGTRSGKLRATIPVGAGAHGLTYFPQPGRYSLGHNGVYR